MLPDKPTPADATYPRPVEVIFTGICTLTDGKPGAVLQQLLPNGCVDDREIIFPRKGTFDGSGSVGGIYSGVEEKEPGKFTLRQRRFLRMHGDTERVACWKLAARSIELREAADKAEKKAKADGSAPILEVLEPLRREYKKAMPDRRRVIEIMLLDYLRR